MKFENFTQINDSFTLNELPKALSDASKYFAQLAKIAEEYNIAIKALNMSEEPSFNDFIHVKIEGFIAQYDTLYNIAFNLIESDVKGSLGLYVESTIRMNKEL